jgi:acyl-CoA thioesterase
MNEEKPVLESAEQVNERLRRSQFPFNQFLGVRVAEAADDGLTMETQMRPEWGNVIGSMHGGITASLIDTAVGIAVFRAFGFARQVTTVELKVNYLRPVVAGKVTIKARLLKTGKTLIVGVGDVFDQEGAHCATSLVTYMAL